MNRTAKIGLAGLSGLAVLCAVGAALAGSVVDNLEARALVACDAGGAALSASLWRRAAETGAPKTTTVYAGLLDAGEAAPQDKDAIPRNPSINLTGNAQ